MAEYGYVSGDYTTSSRIGPRSTDPYRMHSGAANGQVTFDGQGRTKPDMYFSDSYGTKPFVEQPEYKYSSPGNRWGRPSSPVRDRDSLRAGEFFTKIQNEVSQPTHGTMDWRRPPYSSTGHNSGSGHSECSDYSKNDSWNRPSGHTIRNDGLDDYYRRNDGNMEVINTSGGWGSRPNWGGWRATPDSSLTKPTNSIGEAVEMLKEAAVPTSSQQGGFTAPVAAGYKYTETIDMDATRRYGNFKLTSRSPNRGGYY